MKQGLRRNASAIEAYAARIRLGINQRNFHAEVGSKEGGSVTPRAGTYDREV